jgi:hypothetical protein
LVYVLLVDECLFLVRKASSITSLISLMEVAEGSMCSVTDELPPNINIEVSELRALVASALSQVFENQSLLQQSNPDASSPVGSNDSQSSLAGSTTSNTSLSHGTEQGGFEKPNKRRAAE